MLLKELHHEEHLSLTIFHLENLCTASKMTSMSENEAKFYNELQSKIKLVQMYENLSLQKYAIELVPVEDLNVKATIKLSLLENDNDIGLEDLLLLELLNWFKFSFFTWVDIPKCEFCGNVPIKKGIIAAEESEIIWGASRVENYFCSECQKNIRFPRYNHPKKLLETRKGRCGEWANCFTLLCRALGYDARIVVDWNDHIWTEVFSFSRNKWLHCDPCENICDKPLIYEKGWKKKISYIIAFSKDEIQDVTWRYTSNFKEVMSRRNLCREKWLINCILSITHKLQVDASPERKNELLRRSVLELAEFLTPANCEEVLGGRTSGSLAWRIARGEIVPSSAQNSYVFTLCAEEIERKHFHIKYSCASDKYIRVSDQFNEKENWSTCVFSYNNIFRKVERDWNKVYLARTEGSAKGLISWKFSFEESGLAIRTLKLNLGSATFDRGKVKWFLCPDTEEGNLKVFENEAISDLQTCDFEGSTGLIISAELTDGSGVIAWQHSQLFRQSLDSNEYPFEVEISLDKL